MARRTRNSKLKQREEPDKLAALNESQGYLLSAIEDDIVIFAKGPAGTGKTYLSVIRACEMLYEGSIERVVLTRPNIETAKCLGALPGTLEEKLDPYFKTMTFIIQQRFSKGWLDSQLNNNNIELAALGFVQGATYDNTIVIVDEAEHLDVKEMYIILTRIGVNSKMILCGDNFQKFTKGVNGFDDASRRLAHIDKVRVCDFTSDDIVRSGIVKEIVKAYED